VEVLSNFRMSSPPEQT